MLFHLLEDIISTNQYIAIASFIAFALCFVLLKLKLPFLPKDKGREFAVNGEASKGKIRGVGLIMVCAFIVCGVFLLPLNREFVCYYILLFLEFLV